MILIQVQLFLSQIAIKSDFEWGPISPKSMRIHADPDHDQSMKENSPIDTGRPTLVMHSTSITYYY